MRRQKSLHWALQCRPQAWHWPALVHCSASRLLTLKKPGNCSAFNSKPELPFTAPFLDRSTLFLLKTHLYKMKNTFSVQMKIILSHDHLK